MKKHHLRAVVLAAGHGSRLRPLTTFIPKPLLPVRGRPAAAHTIRQLAKLGCEGVAVNLFHRGEQIRRTLGDTCDGVPLTYSSEEVLRGTLGALVPMREFLRPAEMILVVNGDSLCHWPLRSLLRRHLRSGAEATLLVSKTVDPAPFGGGVRVEEHRRIVGFRADPAGTEAVARRVFMGAHVISPRLLLRLPDRIPADFVADLYEPLLAEGATIAAVETTRKWHDLGTPERYRRAVLDWGRRRGWMAVGAEVARNASVRGSVIETDVLVREGSSVRGSLVLPGARIGAGCDVVESIIGPGVSLPPNTSVQRRLVTQVKADIPVAPDASVVGGLVYGPI